MEAGPVRGMKISGATAAATSTFIEDPYCFCCALCNTLFDRTHRPQHQYLLTCEPA